jgi:aminopeptidase YwaD
MLLPETQYRLIREHASGELPLVDFRQLLAFSGFVPSKGAEGVASYLVAKARALGLTNISMEHFPSDAEPYCWAFRREPSWEGLKGELWLVEPSLERLADFKAVRSHLGRNSRTASVTAPLVDVGSGVDPKDYEGRSVQGKLVLASGSPSQVMRLAVWERQALGVISYRIHQAMDFPDQIGLIQLVPWEGPHGEAPTFAFSLSYRAGKALRDRLTDGEALTLHAEVEADIGAGLYPEVRAEIPGTDPDLPAVLLYAHANSRNTGGANNLTGVGCTLEVARVLSHLVDTGALARPRRTIRFMWGAEHYGIQYYFHKHPDDLKNVLAMINIDLVGLNQQTSGAVLHLYRSPYSNPSFIDDIMEAFLEKIGKENSISIRHANFLSNRPSSGFIDPNFAPTGSHGQLNYRVERFWGPSVHEGAQALGIKAVLLMDYPDAFLSTQDDSIDAVDPTQMRRGVVLSATAAYFMASASSADAPTLLLNAVTKAQKRLIDDEIKACDYLLAADAPRLQTAYLHATNLVSQGILRETTSLDSLSALIGSQSLQQQAGPFHEELQAQQRLSQRCVDAYVNCRAAQLKVHLEPSLLSQQPASEANNIPRRTRTIRGPVNFYRLEYGRWWLIDKTGDERFERHVALAQRGEYMTYEALNFADGKRTLAQIRAALSAEFEPVPLSEVIQYFELMEKVGVVEIDRGASLRNVEGS